MTDPDGNPMLPSDGENAYFEYGVNPYGKPTSPPDGENTYHDGLHYYDGGY